jgi:hypothetical protein
MLRAGRSGIGRRKLLRQVYLESVTAVAVVKGGEVVFEKHGQPNAGKPIVRGD